MNPPPIPIDELNRYSGQKVPAVVSDDDTGVEQLTELAISAGSTRGQQDQQD